MLYGLCNKRLKGSTRRALYVAGMEVSAARQRAHIALLQCVGWTVGMALTPLVAWAVGGHWKVFVALTTLPCAVVFFAFRSVSTCRHVLCLIYQQIIPWETSSHATRKDILLLFLIQNFENLILLYCRLWENVICEIYNKVASNVKSLVLWLGHIPQHVNLHSHSS
jgi:hypothetical protein